MNLALNADRYSHDDSPYGSRLLHDPTPEYMIELLSRCGKAIFACHADGEIPSHAAQVMLSVICSSLTILCQISQTASFVLSSFRIIGNAAGLKIKNDELNETKKAKAQDVPTLAACDPTFIDGFLREMQVQASLTPSNLAVGRGTKGYTPEDFNYSIAS